MNENSSMYYVGGSKGGVGKSLFSFALADYLLSQERNVLLVDTDTDNPDVFKAHDTLELPNLHCEMNALDGADGWAELLDMVQRYPEHTVVINAAARTKTSTASYGEIMQGALREMQRELGVFWIINRQRDSIELLHSFQQAFTDTVIHVCRNLHFGEPERFDLYNASKTREAVEQTGKTLDFPSVANRVVDWLYSKRMSIRAAYPEMPFGTRAELQRWRARCREMFDRVLPKPEPDAPEVGA
jgi:cellulose biosynthesis protein BcsQ